MSKICTKHKQKNIQTLKIGKLKITSIRLQILDVFEHSSKPLRVKDICKIVNSDIVSVYRNLKSLINLGYINQIFLDQKEAYFELSNKQHHHHAVCVNCGVVADIKNLNHNFLDKQALTASNFALISKHSLEFFGLCKKCKK